MSLDPQAWNTLFVDARTHHTWTDAPVSDDTLRALYELARLGPTATNASPLRLTFVRSPEAKARLRPALDGGNVDKTMAAPVTAIAAYDDQFYLHLDRLAPHRPGLGEKFAGMPEARRIAMARTSATLQIGYLIVAARGLGLDCGPMGGFDAAAVDAAFFPDGRWRALLLINLGHGDRASLKPRAPRLEFDDACTIV